MSLACDWCGHELRSGEEFRIQVICAPCVPDARFEDGDFDDVLLAEEFDDLEALGMSLPDEPWPDIDDADIDPPPWIDDRPFG